ncbi:hypothetical protein O8B93_07765 [Agrobacterium rhizogenes]|uniref:hypothetical protein n=1 Tax=Rhizobium rhizogenes TaxID=359 RepID=UPI0022B67B22|nr:hypothetical protein [Rhizobium rhizogenes]MCZ7447482.1 hypothetical protein [Rhizobium rhizogenes]
MLLGVFEPGAIAASAEAERNIANRRDQVHDALQRDLEAASFTADRAFRQYYATDPESRLVASELEARWNKALTSVGEIENKIASHKAAIPQVSSYSMLDIAALAGNLRAAWSAPATYTKLKKRILRTVIHEVVADLDDVASEIVLVIHWAGGVHTELRLPKRRHGQRNATPDDLIAGILNRNGLTTGNGNRWTSERVTALRSYRNIPV